MNEPVILHCDINHCYAQIEEMKYPALKAVPMCVGGDESKRHGIVLARNLAAKTFGVKTAEPLRDALIKCPQLVVCRPSFSDYSYYCERIKDVYRDYTDALESMGLDEAWLDVSDSIALFGDGYSIAKTIQDRVFEEFGLTISVGISFNKIFAKLGSDLKKPRGIVEITKRNFSKIVWPLDVEELFSIGPKTGEKLRSINLKTVGDIAQSDPKMLRKLLGKHGSAIWSFANGCDPGTVSSDQPKAKSVGNSVTPPKDMADLQDLRIVLYVLVESVAARLKANGQKGSLISVAVRDQGLQWFSKQKQCVNATNIVSEIIAVAFPLASSLSTKSFPLRSLSLTVSKLEDDSPYYQFNLFEDTAQQLKNRSLDTAMETIRQKFGFKAIKRCSVLMDPVITDFDPRGSDSLHAIGWIK